MTTQIKCPHCNNLFEPSDAFKHELEGKLIKEMQGKHIEELERLKVEKERLVKENEKEIENLTKKVAETATEEAERKFGKELEEERARSKKFSKQLEELLDQMRELKRKDGERDIEMKKKLLEEEDKIRKDTQEKVMEEHQLKDKEKEKVIHDLQKALEDAQRKAQQGSQQTQGEVLELEIEELLRREFPTDSIEEVKKGQRGADISQKVIDRLGRSCGTILWESKNAKWSNEWIGKLKDDQRAAHASLAVLVVTDPPENLDGFKFRDGIWIVIRKMIVPLAIALRFDLVRVNQERLANIGKNEKTEILYQYITSTEFKHRVEAITDVFDSLQMDLEKEQKWFENKWAKQKMLIRKVLDNTHGMYGDLQGVVGKSLPDLKMLE